VRTIDTRVIKKMEQYISRKEESVFLTLFIRNGYVLDFSDDEFNKFTLNSIGEALKEEYGLSKGKSLKAYLENASDRNRTKLLMDLFRHYEEKMEYEFNPEYEEDLWMCDIKRYDERCAHIYRKCKAIINRLDGVVTAISQTADELKSKFSSRYLSAQIDMMKEMQTKNPTEAIGKAKELIESCCKTILDDLKISWIKNDDVPQLTSKVMKALNLLPENVQVTDKGADTIKAALGNLRAIPTELAKLRNLYGSGHGKSASYRGLEIRHAKLAVGCSITFVDFIWSTYELQKK